MVTEQPFARQFDLAPLQWVLDNRLDMLTVACILTLGPEPLSPLPQAQA